MTTRCMRTAAAVIRLISIDSYICADPGVGIYHNQSFLIGAKKSIRASLDVVLFIGLPIL
jgi:hypothetical protein